MKKSRQEPVFLLEMPEPIRHLIIKRGHVLRGSRTRNLSALPKTCGTKSWLQARLIPFSGESTEETWDKAHDLADKFKREMHHDVYVEPASRAGRYQSMIAQDEVGSADHNQINYSATTPGSVARSGFAANPAPLLAMQCGISNIGMSGPNHRLPGFGASMITSNISIPQIPDPLANQMSGLPPEVSALLANHPATLSREVTCPALRRLHGWNALAENTQQMFETEAAQLIMSGLTIDATPGLSDVKRSTLDLVRLQPNVSKMLKHYIDQALVT